MRGFSSVLRDRAQHVAGCQLTKVLQWDRQGTVDQGVHQTESRQNWYIRRFGSQ